MNYKKKNSDTLENRFMGSQKENRIKFDRRDRKIYFVLAIVASIWFAFEVIVVYMGDLLSMPDIINIAAVSTYYPMMFFAPAAWLRFFDVCLYLKKLKSYGYEVPADARVYDNKLEKLPRTEITIHKNKINDSVINTAVSAIITIGVLLYNIWFLYKFQGMPLWIFNLIGLFLWMIVTLHYAGQISNIKYKDSVELDDTRKKRESLMEAMLGLLLLLLFSIVAANIIIALANVARKARLGI